MTPECAKCAEPYGPASCIPTFTIHGKRRIAYGDEEVYKTWDFDLPEHCHDCGVALGGFHQARCDMERCPNCGDQFFVCPCEADMRTKDEVKAAEYALYSRRWYQVSVERAEAGLDSAKADTSRQMVALENPMIIDDLEHRSEFHTGWLLGAHQALRWVLGHGKRIEDASADT